MLAKHLGARILLSGLLLVLLQSRLPSLAAVSAVQGNMEKSKNSTEFADDAKRKAAVREIWAKYQRLGTAAFKKNDLQLSLEMFVQAVQEAELLNFDRADLLLSLDSLAIVYQQLGRMQDSLQAEKKALEFRSRLGGENKPARIDSLIKIADIYTDMGDVVNAKNYLQQAMSLLGTEPGGDELKAKIMESLLSVSSATHDRSGEKEYVSKLLQHDQGRAPDENAANHLELFARILWQEGQLSQASQCLSRALSIRKLCQSPDDPAIIAVSRNFIRANLILGSASEAEKDLSKVLSYDRLHLAPNSADYLFDLLSLAEIKLDHGEPGAARSLAEEVLSAQKESKNQNTLDLADASSIMARICAAQNQWYESLGLAGRAISLRQSLGLPDALSVYDYETLARAASAQGQKQEAENKWQKAMDIRLQSFSADQASLSRVKAELESLRDQVAKAKDEKQL